MGIAKDSAFSFYYNDNIELFKHLGVEIILFSPVKDKKIPENLDILYFGGGYPEFFAKEIGENQEVLNSIREFAENGGKIFWRVWGIYVSF